MATNTNYEYTDESPVGSKLICSICNSPFNDPLCTPCDHTFCRNCITNSIHTRNIGCPLCRQRLGSVNNLVAASRIIQNMLDRLQVICLFCRRAGLQRGNFREHAGRECSKVHIPCSAADIKCPWKGPRDQLDAHIKTCVFQPFRTVLTDLITSNQQLEEQIQQQGTQIQQQDAQIKQRDAQIQQQGAQIQQQDAQIKQQDAQIKQQNAQIKQQGAQIQQQGAQIQQQGAQIQQQGTQIQQQGTQIQQLGDRTELLENELSSK